MTTSIAQREIHGVTDAQHCAMEKTMTALAKIAGTADPGIEIHEMLHAGCYVRTAKIPADTLFVSAQILIPTVLIISGDCFITDTENTVRITGYEVLTGARMRQGIIRTLTETYMTAIFATDAKTTREAEASAVADTSRLYRSTEG